MRPAAETPLDPSFRLEYEAARPIDGVMIGLLPKLQPVLGYDRLRVSRQRGWLSQVYLTVFRRQAKRLFHVQLLRRGSKWVIRMGGGDPARVLQAIRVCRDHFDAWFGVEGSITTDSRPANELHPG